MREIVMDAHFILMLIGLIIFLLGMCCFLGLLFINYFQETKKKAK
jgi:hypothetical protein